MDHNELLQHFAIASYDLGPPPNEPVWLSLCVIGRTEGAVVTRQCETVSCPVCRNYMRELLM